ncbi:hypothetical protein ACGXOO_004642 [Salmonella enterica subsp. enterica serovar Braenderup]|nr:hypothetical protein [Salmonella enterica]HAU6729965.1 hypothetical protein [Salmonella enterica subsp. enterica serovar Falkensee]
MSLIAELVDQIVEKGTGSDIGLGQIADFAGVFSQVLISAFANVNHCRT